MHLLSEQSKWLTTSEFIDPNGQISKAVGETIIIIQETEILNKSWVEMNGTRLENTYKIRKINDFMYNFESFNPALGVQKGTFNIDRNIIYSKFFVENSKFDGFEVIIRNQNKCTAYGALYNNDILVNTWTAIMKKNETS